MKNNPQNKIVETGSLRQALYAMEPVNRDQEKYNVSTALSSQVMLTNNNNNSFAVILDTIRLNLSFVDKFILKSAEHLSGISK